MRTAFKRTGFVLLAFVLLIAALLASASAILNIAPVKSYLDRTVSESAELMVRIDGPIGLSFVPSFGIRTHDVRVGFDMQQDVASAREIRMGVRLLELVSGHVHIDQVEIREPTVTLDDQGWSDFMAYIGEESQGEMPVDSLTIDSFSVSKAAIAFNHEEIVIDVSEFNLSGKNLNLIESRSLPSDNPVDFIRTSTFGGNAEIERFSAPDLDLDHIRLQFKGENAHLEVQPVELQYFGEQVKLAGQINLGAKIPQIQLQFEMPGLDVERFLKRVGEKGRINGILMLSGKFASEGANTDEMVKQLQGEFSIRGSGLVLKGFNLDKVLEEVKKVQGYGLLDFAALLTAGPMATVATQGFSKLDALYRIGEVEGDGRISQIVSDWKIANGVATAMDVAFSTLKQRVAVQGALDILNGRYRELTIADVDAKGCVITSETIDGPFDEAEIKETGILDRTVFRPLKKLLGPECQPFYVGAVAHPAAVQSQ